MSNQLHYNTLSLNDDTKSCIIDGNEVNLTKREYQLLKFFLENPNYIYTRKIFQHKNDFFLNISIV